MQPDELLPEPPRRAALRWLAGLVAAAVLVALVVARVAATRHEAAPEPTPSPGPVRPTSAAVYVYDPTACPNGSPCNVSSVLPSGALAALREHGAHPVKAHTVGTFLQVASRNGLWFRQVDAVAGPVRVQVIIERSAPRAGSQPTVSVDGPSGFVRVLTGPFAVSVQFTGPAGYHPPMAAIRALAADPRLLATG
jgi:hypothetical protein